MFDSVMRLLLVHCMNGTREIFNLVLALSVIVGSCVRIVVWKIFTQIILLLLLNACTVQISLSAVIVHFRFSERRWMFCRW